MATRITSIRQPPSIKSRRLKCPRTGAGTSSTTPTSTGSCPKYNPVLGRFISRDPLSGAEFSQGTNLYAYCGNNLINCVDATGTIVKTGTVYIPSIPFVSLTFSLQTDENTGETTGGMGLTLNYSMATGPEDPDATLTFSNGGLNSGTTWSADATAGGIVAGTGTSGPEAGYALNPAPGGSIGFTIWADTSNVPSLSELQGGAARPISALLNQYTQDTNFFSSAPAPPGASPTPGPVDTTPPEPAPLRSYNLPFAFPTPYNNSMNVR